MQHTHRAVSSESRENAEQLLKLSVTSFLVSLSTELQQSCGGGKLWQLIKRMFLTYMTCIIKQILFLSKTFPLCGSKRTKGQKGEFLNIVSTVHRRGFPKACVYFT